MKNSFSLRLLDAVQVEWEGKPVQGFESQKALALLCYLVMQERPVFRTYLVNLFWPDKSEKRGRGNLSRVLSNLRVLLPGCLNADQHRVAFCLPSDCWVDVFRFKKLIAQDDIEGRTAAAALYYDDFMSGFFLNDCPGFETWLITQQEYWRQQIIRTLLTLIEHHAFDNAGDYERGLDFATQLLALEPWREEAHRKKMRLLAYSGQRSAALMQYRSCCRALADEFGVEPSRETISLYEQIRDGEVTKMRPLVPIAPRPAAHSSLYNFLPPLIPFLGRRIELVYLSRLLAEPTHHWLVMSDSRGAGKT